MCTFSLFSQLQHGLELALFLVALGTIALGLDRFATVLDKAGASDDTVRMVRFAAKCLLAFDLAVVLALAASQTLRAIFCLV